MNLDMKMKAQDRRSTTVMTEGHTLPVSTVSTTIQMSHEQLHTIIGPSSYRYNYSWPAVTSTNGFSPVYSIIFFHHHINPPSPQWSTPSPSQPAHIFPSRHFFRPVLIPLSPKPPLPPAMPSASPSRPINAYPADRNKTPIYPPSSTP